MLISLDISTSVSTDTMVGGHACRVAENQVYNNIHCFAEVLCLVPKVLVLHCIILMVLVFIDSKTTVGFKHYNL